MWLAIALVVAVAITLFAMTSPQQDAQATGYEDADIPKIGDSKEIPLLFGCRWMDSAGVSDSGDFRTTEIKS